MAQLQRGETFIDGQTVTAARLNNLVDMATALNGLIMDRTISAVTSNDQILLWDDSTNALRRAPVSVVVASGGVTSVALTMPTASFNIAGSPITSTGTLGVTWKTQAKNKVLIGPQSGADATPTWRTLTPADGVLPTVTIAASDIDWSLGTSFFKLLTGHFTPTFSNPKEGQSITVRIQNAGGWYQNWDYTGAHWPGGISPNPGTLDAGHSDVLYFQYINGYLTGGFAKNYF